MEFRDLIRQYERLKSDIDRSISEVITSASFISGKQVLELEERLAAYVGAKHCVSCANGTDAISIALEAMGVKKGDAVFVPDFTFFSSGECPASVGATPIFVDVDRNTYNISPFALEREIMKVLEENVLKPKAVIAVDLFGLPADYAEIKLICKRHGLLLLEDSAQGFGGSITERDGKKKFACSFGDISITSFFPAKPLGCYGDGGAIFTDNDEWASMCRSIAVHGRDMKNPDDPMSKYNNTLIGRNSRLDTLQAAILLVKLKAFCEHELDAVNRIAMQYTDYLGFDNQIEVPVVPKEYFSSWAQYTIKLGEGCDRDAIQKRMRDKGIPTMVYYVKPMHAQGAFMGTRSAVANCPNTNYLCKHVLCLPIHPYMTDDECKYVSDVLLEAIS